jgi:protoporphyrinogen oxidase
MGAHATVVILGGGLTGLSAAAHLTGIETIVLERESDVGGLCRTTEEDGFTFDCTGHLLHLRDPGIRDLVSRLLPGSLVSHERRALIHSQGVQTAYPFQANLSGLPDPVVAECVSGFVEALLRREREGEPDLETMSFRTWAEATFGRGIAAHFMVPYNAKLWRTDLDEIECGWVSWSIPRPSLEEVLGGAFSATVRGLGYNPTFLYPRRGGIRLLPEALASRAGEVRLGAEVASVDAAARTVRLRCGETISYEALVSTLPLDRLLAIADGLPEGLGEVGRRLRAVRVLNICLGIDRPSLSRAHWIYFPEKEYSFYRIGFPSSLSPSMAPRGCSSVWAERSLGRTESFDPDEAVATTVEDLRRAGILRTSDKVIYSRVGVLDPAYVIYDRYRARNLRGTLEALASLGIHSAGRFGAWEYSSMEAAMKTGADLAQRLQARLADRLEPPRRAAGGRRS